jgi:UDP-glucose 4-epimerase
VLIKSPGSVRDYIYIDDVVDFMISAASKRKSLGILNLGAGECRSVIDVVDVINGITGRELDIKISTEEYLRPEPDPWVSDMSRSKRILKWKAGNTFGEGMKKTIEWEKRTGAWKS